MERVCESDSVLRIDCASAREFLRVLQPIHKTWRGETADRWLFRGHRDQSWKLLPRVFREGKHLVRGKLVQFPMADGVEQVGAEHRLLYEFVTLADDVGVRLPEGSLHVLNPWDGDQRDPEWPRTAVWNLLASAAHHGVPTRLLDFTYDPLVAAFFAAGGDLEDAPHPCRLSPRMCVWAFDRDFLQKWYEPPNTEPQIESLIQRVLVVSAPRAENQFLANQRGSFLLTAQGAVESRPIDLVEIVRQGVEGAKDSPPFRGLLPPLIKVTCPASAAREVLRLLERYHVSRVYLMPTLDNVANAVMRSESRRRYTGG